jgi:subtilase family serine protease
MPVKFVRRLVGTRFVAIACALVLLPLAAYAQNSGRQLLKGHVPAAVSRLHLQPLGRLSATNRLNLAIGLSLRNQQAINNLLQQIYDPASPNYHHYLTPEQFTEQFGPTKEDYEAVAAFMESKGLKVAYRHPNRVVLAVNGSVADIEKAFHVGMQVYQHPTEARTFYAPDTEPSVDVDLPILSVQGMNNYIKPRPMLHKMPASKINPATGSGPNGAYMGSDFRKAYVPGTTLNGSGQIVGLLQFDGYYPSDITNYESLAGLPNVPLQNVLLDEFDGTPGEANDEVCLDIETSISMAPGLSKVVVFEGYYPNNILSSMAASNQIKQFSASWGYEVNGTTEGIYQQLALQGQTFLNASGDGDAWLGGIPLKWGSCEDPNITIVGGTTLKMNGTGGSYLSEKVLNWGYNGTIWNPDGYFGSSGGISTDVSIPSWQQGINMTTNHGSTTMRNVPDVALTADNVFVVYSNGISGSFGGTSCASPLWAGFIALVNQQAVSQWPSDRWIHQSGHLHDWQGRKLCH